MKTIWGDKSLDDILQNDNLSDKKLMEINEGKFSTKKGHMKFYRELFPLFKCLTYFRFD